MGPVSAELKFHRDARHDTEHEVNAENFGPEAGSLVISLVITAESQSLQHHNQRGQAHGELGEEVMKRDRKRKMETVNQQCTIHSSPLCTRAYGAVNTAGVIEITFRTKSYRCLRRRSISARRMSRLLPASS